MASMMLSMNHPVYAVLYLINLFQTMSTLEYEKQFELLVKRMSLAREAYDNAVDIGKQDAADELQALKNQLLELSRAHQPLKPSHPKPDNEISRLSALRHLQVLDSPFESMFDDITKLASHVCDAPIALISLLDENRQWFKSQVGLPGVTETHRDMAFCAHTIMTPDLMEIEDATLDVRFATNPLVTGEPSIRFYAGAPITLPQGESVGTLCVIDRKAHSLSEYQRETLRGLARLVSHALLLRHTTLQRTTIS